MLTRGHCIDGNVLNTCPYAAALSWCGHPWLMCPLRLGKVNQGVLLFPPGKISLGGSTDDIICLSWVTSHHPVGIKQPSYRSLAAFGHMSTMTEQALKTEILPWTTAWPSLLEIIRYFHNSSSTHVTITRDSLDLSV